MNARPGGTMASGTSGDPVVTTDADPPSGRVAGAGRGPRRKAAADRTGSRRASASAQPSDPRGTRAGRAVRTRSTAGRRAAPVAAACPYCAVLLQPAPASSQRCARCRQRIVVRRVDGRAVYLTEAALPVFQAERRRIASAGRLNRDRARWLKLAAAAGAPADRAARLGAAEVSEQVVEGCRTLYMSAVERAFRAARRERRWEDARGSGVPRRWPCTGWPARRCRRRRGSSGSIGTHRGGAAGNCGDRT